MKGAKIAKQTRKRIRIRPKTADLLYRNRLINSWVFVSLFLVILHLIVMNSWIDVGIQDISYEIDNDKHQSEYENAADN